jgi:hypothetical protein
MDKDNRSAARKWVSSIVEFICFFVGIGRPGFMRRLRESMLARRLKRLLDAEIPSPVFSWQPLSWIALKLAAMAAFSLAAMRLEAPVAAFIARSIDFLKLAEVFGKPGAAGLPALIARWGVIALVLALVLPPALRLAAAAFTSVVACREKRVLYVFRNFILWRGITEIRIDEIETAALEQNALFRIFGMGTIVARTRSGGSLRLRSLWGAAGILRALS